MSLLARLFKRFHPVRLAPTVFVERSGPGDPVLDVRSPGEFARGHLKGALNVDIHARDFEQRIEQLAARGTLAPDRPVYLYCRSGSRSGRAARLMRSMGYGEAWNVGGFGALRRAGAETEG